MKLEHLQVIREDYIGYNDWEQALDKNKMLLQIYGRGCSDAVAMPTPLFHGRNDHTDDVFSRKYIRSNRRPMDTTQWFNDVFNELVAMKFGSPIITRTNSCFLTQHYDLAEVFGDLYFALPSNDTQFLVYNGQQDTKATSYEFTRAINMFYDPDKKSYWDIMTPIKHADSLTKDKELMAHLFDMFKNNLLYFSSMASLASFLTKPHQAEIMASGVEFIPLVKVPYATSKEKAWKELKLQIAAAGP